MSYTLISCEMRKARKPHRCIWCGEAIAVGDSYEYERSIFDGKPQSHHWHPECLKAMHSEAADEGGSLEFMPHDNERPVTTATDERKP